MMLASVTYTVPIFGILMLASLHLCRPLSLVSAFLINRLHGMAYSVVVHVGKMFRSFMKDLHMEYIIKKKMHTRIEEA